ncbi:unnamed protein product [marine sediment metagenome]|uniref:Asn/Gln amidotransferase domain-containing protein n=1 Tax=marine sediment metagenome TaxID=412755 RepID=X1JP48_9ZZZZ
MSILKSIKHDGDNTDKISNDQLIKLFEIYKKRMFDRELIPEILIDLIKDKPLSKIIEELSLKKSDDNKIRATIQQVVKEYSTTIKNREKKLDFLIGRIKNKMSSHVSGKKILQLLNENIGRRGNNYE